MSYREALMKTKLFSFLLDKILSFKLSPIDWQFIRRKLPHIFLLGALVAVGMALYPQALCAAGQCNEPRDQWCGGTATNPKCCAASAGFTVVISCHPADNPAGASYCAEDTTQVPVRCQNNGDCEVTEVLGSPDRLKKGYWYVGSCPSISGGLCEKPFENTNGSRATCCGGSDDSSGGCVPTFAPPSVGETFTSDPPNPLPWGQEQPPYGSALGVTLSRFLATGGVDVSCNSGARQPITSMTVKISLQPASAAWIENELSKRYYGAHVYGSYPQFSEQPAIDHPSSACQGVQQIGFGTPQAELDCQWFKPLDPGRYDIIVKVCQGDAQCREVTLPTPLTVSLLDTTLVQP